MGNLETAWFGAVDAVTTSRLGRLNPDSPAERQADSEPPCGLRIEGCRALDLGVFSSSQLVEISRRFPAHVEEMREFLLKEKLPVLSPDAIPEVAARLESEGRFRADVGSLLRATLYRERERVGHEDLLGILVTAAAGTFIAAGPPRSDKYAASPDPRR